MVSHWCATRIAPNEELTNALRPHIRDADGMSAQELDNNALGELEQDIRNEVTRLAAEDTRAAEIQALEQSIIEQLNTAGQTTAEANRTYATLYTANVDVFSRQMDLSPQEYHAQYGIHIVGGNIVVRTQAGEQTLTPAEAARRLAAGAEAAAQAGQQNTANPANNTATIDAETTYEAARYGGMDITGRRRTIAHDASVIRQADGQEQRAPLTDADRTTINDTIANPEVRVYGLKTPDGQRALVSVKALPEGGVAVVEEVPAGGQTLAARTLRRYEGDTQQALKTLRDEARQRGNQDGIFELPVTPKQDSAQDSYQQTTANTAQAEEFEATAQRYGGEAAYEQAKAAGQTELDYRQWVQVRTPSFKAWFGDWEAARDLNVDSPASKDSAEATLKALAGKALTNNETGLTAYVNRDQRGKMLSAAARRKSENNGFSSGQHYALAQRIEQLWRHATFVGEFIDTKHGDANIRIKRFAAPVRMEDSTHYVTILAKENIAAADGQRIYTLELHTEETLRSTLGNLLSQQTESISPIRSADDIIEALAAKVNPNATSKVVNPQTGEPQVVYHGTNAQFDTFDTPLNMPRIFLTRSRAFAQKYGRDAMPLFVNARNTLNVDYAGRSAFDEIEVNGETLYDIEELADHAWANGYDGVLADHVVDSGTRDAKQSINDEVIVTDPAQIKSATGNSGAFDAANPNIHYQNYRRNNRDVPFNDVPYMMFADEAEKVEGYGRNLWELPDEVGNRISASDPAFREALGKYLRENIDRLREDGYGAGLSDEELVQNLVDEADPGYIVASAGLWDINESWILDGIWEEVLEPNGWNVVDTSDGALAFDPELVRRVDMDEEGNIIDYIPPQATTEEEQAIKAGRKKLREAEAALQEAEERNARARRHRDKVAADIRARGQEPGENYWEAFDLDTEKSAYFADRESAQAWADEQAGDDPGRFGVYEHAMPREKDTTALQEQVAALQEYAPQTLGQYLQEQAAPRGAFSPDSNTITLTPNADLSTFIHELGHYFLETLTRHATELRARNDAGEALTDGQKQIIKDADTILANLGGLDLDTWHSMTIEEKRSHHELAARQFETYILEGKAPSLELQGAFQRFRAWLLRIYKAARNLNAPLNDEVRQVFDRMLATSDAIELAEQNRSMMQLFENAEEAGMTPEQFAAYQQQGRDATQAAQDEMQARALRDTQYIRNLRNKALRRKQQEAKAARQQAEMQARQMVLGLPVYRVWQFLSGTMTADTTIASNKRAWTDAVDPAHDDLNTAIAKLGGLNRDAVEQEWGLDPADRIPDIRPGFPVLRRNGGLSVDGMRQALVEQGYLNDNDSLNDFYTVFDAQQRGQTQYSKLHQPDPGSGKAGEHAHLHDLPTLRLDREALLELGYSEAQIKKLGRKVSKTGGVHPDLVAELFQDEDGNAIYDSGDAMVQALLAAKRPQDAINDVADDIMLQQFGELATPQAVAFAADMAVHNDIRLRVIASEANALAKAVGNKTLLNRAARQLAQETIAAKRLRDIHPAQYTRMEARAAKAAALAQKKGDIATAAAEKRNQLLQAHLARAAYEAQEEAATHLRYLKRMSRLNPKNIDIKQREQIEAILERYNLREQSKKAIDRSQTLAQWVEEQRKQGIEVNIDPKVLDEANRTPWQHLSLTDLRGLRDSIKQIEHQGRLKNTLLLARKNRDYNATVASLVAGIEQHASRSGIENRTPTTTFGRAGAQLRRFFTAHLRTAMIARRMDGDRDGGAWWDNLIRPANERADWQTSENARATEALARILAPLIAQKGLNQKRSYTIGGKTRSFTLQDIFVMGLNYGNDSNAQRLLGGENWQAAEFEQLLSQLNAEQLNALQGVWDTFEQYKPQIADVTRRVLGIEPEWIVPRPFTITSADGQVVNLRGGYYPVMYDPRASAVAADQELHDMESGAYSAAVINRGFLKSRVAEVHNRPLLYNMAGIYRGLNNVIHYLAWYEWQLDSNRLLNSKRVSDAIRDHYGDDVYRQFKSWARDIAVGDLQIESEGVALVNAVRRNAGVAGLGFNIISALKQPLGLFQSVGRVGGQHILPQLGRWMIHARQMTREAKAQSAFMQNRARTRFRELNELAASLSQKNKLQTFLARHSYTLIMFVQMQVDVITWHAQQQKSLEAGASIAEANRHADQAVIDSQGSGMLKDLSAAERGHIMKLFTIYYGFMNTIMNLNYNTLTSTRQGKIEKAVNLTVLLAIAPILEAALSDLLKPGDSDRWDKENAAKTMAIAMMNNLFGQFIILREFNLSGYDYSGPVGLRAIADAYKLRDEIRQGEWDSGLRRAAIGIGGSVFGLPAAQINRTLDGLQALDDGDTDNPLAVLLGKPQQ
ncbi:hypothetical protein [uncultured Cardiobacterium sp.]|uniref:ADP-ribosyltransferase-containing protein n=1 Tax=uncultured Cardiobacterium sp. TaxID=417619 RepID=UPI00262BEFD2|nr:hypothetical protein [uncultured Cardiobacterium sp.]